MSIEFGRWLDAEIQQRHWRINEASRELQISHGFLRSLLNGSKNPGRKSIAKITTGLNLPQATVLEAAGLLKPGDAPDPNSAYATIRGLIDVIDWDSHPDWALGIIGHLRSYVNNQPGDDEP